MPNQTIMLPRTNLKVSKIAFGCWPIGGHRWGSLPPKKEIVRCLHLAVDQGITLFDTAPLYGFGRSEALLGEALGAQAPTPYHDAIIATKFGLSWNDRGRVWHDASPNRIVEEVEASLRRLNREAIDLFQLHWPDSKTPVADIVGTLNDLRNQGKIRHFGASNLSVEQLEEAEAHGGFETLQPRYSLLHRDIEKDLLPWCTRHGVGTLVYSPLAKGLLTGKYGPHPPSFGLKDVRRRDENFASPLYERNHAAIQKFSELARSLDTKPATLALAWLLHQPGVHVVICGIKNRKQLPQAVKAMDLTLDRSTLDKIDELFSRDKAGP